MKEQTASSSQRSLPRPFWLTNSAYYGATGVVALLLFLLIWGLSPENEDHPESGLFPALIAVAVLFAVSIAFHGVVLRRMKNRYLLGGEKLSFPSPRARQVYEEGKFTLEKHAALLKAVQQKSDSTDSAATDAEKHLEVYKACNEYLEQVEAALPSVHTGSPRLAAFRGGQERVRLLQKHHLLQWAEKESQSLLREAQIRIVINDKIEIAQRALETVNAALKVYPDEQPLVDSSLVIHEFIAATYVSYWVELAERAAFKEQYAQAIDHYRDALFYLRREAVSEDRRQTTAAMIESEILRLQKLSGEARTGQSVIISPSPDVEDLEAKKND